MARSDKTPNPRSPVSASRVPYTRYYQRQNTAGPEPGRQNRPLGKAAQKMLNVLIFALLAFSLVYSLLLRQVRITSVTAGSLHTEKQYQAELTRRTAALPYQIKPLFNEGKLSRELIAKYPEITAVDYYIPWLGSKASVRISTSVPTLLITSGATTYVVDGQGRADVRHSDVNNTLIDTLPLVIDQTGFVYGVGRQVLTPQQVGFISEIVRQLSDKGLDVSQFVLPNKAQELDARIAGRNYFVKFYIGGDARTQSGAYLATQHKLQADNIVPAEYIDVRVEERVYVK